MVTNRLGSPHFTKSAGEDELSLRYHFQGPASIPTDKVQMLGVDVRIKDDKVVGWTPMIGEFDPNYSSLAYQYVDIAAMVAQFNYFAPRMQLPVDVPIKAEDVRRLHVSSLPGRFYHDNLSLGGRLQVKDYSFTFSTRTHNFVKLDEFGYASLGIPASAKERAYSVMDRASKMPYTVQTNDVYRLATNWVLALDIDLQKLEAANPPVINPYAVFQSTRGDVPNPILVVEWENSRIKGYDQSYVKVECSAVTGELLRLHAGNGSFSKGPPLIREVEKLLLISNEEFLAYDQSQRRELLRKYVGYWERQGIAANVVLPTIDALFISAGGELRTVDEK